MEDKSLNNLEKIRLQLRCLKQRLENIDQTLLCQEKVLEQMDNKSKSMLQEIEIENNGSSVEEVMRSAFKSNKLPKILFK